MTVERHKRFIRLGAAKAVTRGGLDPSVEFNLRPLTAEIRAMRVTSSPSTPDDPGKPRSTS